MFWNSNSTKKIHSWTSVYYGNMFFGSVTDPHWCRSLKCLETLTQNIFIIPFTFDLCAPPHAQSHLRLLCVCVCAKPQCLPVIPKERHQISDIQRYSPISTDIHWYPPISTDIQRYSPIFTDIYRYPPIFTDIHRYLPIFTDILWYSAVTSDSSVAHVLFFYVICHVLWVLVKCTKTEVFCVAVKVHLSE